MSCDILRVRDAEIITYYFIILYNILLFYINIIPTGVLLGDVKFVPLYYIVRTSMLLNRSCVDYILGLRAHATANNLFRPVSENIL